MRSELDQLKRALGNRLHITFHLTSAIYRKTSPDRRQNPTRDIEMGVINVTEIPHCVQGRPDIKKILRNLSGREVGVGVCGPSAMFVSISKVVAEASTPDTRYSLHNEGFEI